ncbi:MAG: DUF2235 domain-containing protein [Actinomycetota bacterium]|nr:DUF2235 domain-containing protein [Actinomycetota bacterium]
MPDLAACEQEPVDLRLHTANDGVVSKNIVICLDGTGNQMRAKGDTNVVRLYSMLALDAPSSQVAYYDPGVGTFSAQGALTPIAKRFTKLFGLAFGTGLRTNIGEAYLFLMRHWEPGDRIFLFGFSRGAYAARAFSGMLATVGVLQRGSENLIPYAIEVYSRSKNYGSQDWRRLHEFANVFSQQVDGKQAVPIRFVGLWDSVKAAGVLRWNLRWPFTRKLRTAETVRHAVSIHEKRRPYRQYLVTPLALGQHLEEVWFGGVHSDVGGTFDDDSRLSTIALAWMMDGALGAGLLVDPDKLAKECSMSPDDALGEVHRMGWVWAFLTYRKRRVPRGAKVHSSMRARWEADHSFAPNVPDDAVWVDPDWAKDRRD